MVFPWFSYGLPMVFLWFSYGFLMVFPWFPVVFLWFSMVPCGFSWFPVIVLKQKWQDHELIMMLTPLVSQ